MHIQKCIESLLKQSHKDFEIIILDDQSTDETLNLINSFKNTLESASKTFSELMSNIENTVTDEEIKNEAMSVIKKIGTEMEENIKNASSKVSDYFEINKKSEEE